MREHCPPVSARPWRQPSGRALHALALASLGLILSGCAGAPARHATTNGRPSHTLAVLPFTAPGLMPDTNWFTTGFTSELTGSLGHNPNLRVTAWNSAQRFRDSALSPAAIGAALDAHDLLRGTLTGAGDQLVFFVKLVNADDGRVIWSGSFNGATHDLAASEAAIARQVARALHAGTAPERAVATPSPQAHALIWHAQALGWSSPARVKQARQLAERAIAIDPQYAEADALVAETWMAVVMNGLPSLSRAEAIPNAKAAARKALAIDPDNADALFALGNAYFYGNQPRRAAVQFRRVIRVDPSYAEAYFALGDLAHSFTASLHNFTTVARLDPYNGNVQDNIADTYLDLGRYHRALHAAGAYRSLQPHTVDAGFLLALNETLVGDRHAAITAFDMQLPPFSLARRLDTAGKLTYESLLTPALRDKAVAAVDALGATGVMMNATSQDDLMQLQLALGERSAVLAELPALCEQSAVSCADLGSFPLWNPLHGNPQFQTLVKQYDTMSAGRNTARH